MKRILFTDIQWDTDGENLADVLPSSATLDVPADLDVETDGADVLSDKYGFCVFGFNFTEI